MRALWPKGIEMLQSLAPKDIESLSKIAGILIIPFIAAAVYVDFGLWAIDWFKELGWLASTGILIFTYIAKLIAFITSVILVAFAVEVFRAFLYRWPPVIFFLGVTFLTIGVLGLGHIVEGQDKLTLNIYWHLGLLVWGLDIFSSPSHNKATNKDAP